MSGFASNTSGTGNRADPRQYSTTGKRSSKEHGDYATRPTVRDTAQSGGEDLRWSSNSHGFGGYAEGGEQPASNWHSRNINLHHGDTQTGGTQDRSSVFNNASEQGKKNAKTFLDDLNAHEKGLKTTLARNRQLVSDVAKHDGGGKRGGFSFSKSRQNDVTPDEELLAELGAVNEKQLDQQDPAEDSFFKDEKFRPVINAKSIEIAQANKKWKPIDKRFRQEVEQKVKRIKQLAKEVKEERKEKERADLAKSASAKTLKSKTRSRTKNQESMDAYSRNKVWADQKKMRIEHAQKLQKLKELEEEYTFKPVVNTEDPNILVARKAGLGSHLSQMTFVKRQQEYLTRRATSVSQLSSKLKSTSCPFQPRTNLSSAKKLTQMQEPVVPSKPTTATELRKMRNEDRIREIREKMERAKAITSEKEEMAPPRSKTPNKRVVDTSPHLYQAPTVKKVFADVGRGVSPSASLATRLYKSNTRTNKVVRQLSPSPSESRVRYLTGK